MKKFNLCALLLFCAGSIFGQADASKKSQKSFEKIETKSILVSKTKDNFQAPLPKLSFWQSAEVSRDSLTAKLAKSDAEHKLIETEVAPELAEVPSADHKPKRPRPYAKWQIKENIREYGIEVGYANNVATWWSGPKPWDISKHRIFLTSLRYGKILGTIGPVTYSWSIEFIPLSVAIGNRTENKVYRTNKTVSPTFRRNNYGMALNPFSFRFTFLPKFRLRPFAFAGFGASYHLKPVPIESGTKWNAQFDFGIGGQYMISKTRSLQFGYRYYHLSNMYLANYNPGYNSNVFFLGFSFWKEKK